MFGIRNQERGRFFGQDKVTVATSEEANDPTTVFNRRRFLNNIVLSQPHTAPHDDPPLEALTETARQLFGERRDRDGIHLYHLNRHNIGEQEIWCCIAGEYLRVPSFPSFALPTPAHHEYGNLEHLPIIATPPSEHHYAQLYLSDKPETLAQLVISVPHTDDINERNLRIGNTARGFFSRMPYLKEPTGIYVHQAHPHTHTFSSRPPGLDKIFEPLQEKTTTVDIGIAELYRIP